MEKSKVVLLKSSEQDFLPTPTDENILIPDLFKNSQLSAGTIYQNLLSIGKYEDHIYHENTHEDALHPKPSNVTIPHPSFLHESPSSNIMSPEEIGFGNILNSSLKIDNVDLGEGKSSPFEISGSVYMEISPKKNRTKADGFSLEFANTLNIPSGKKLCRDDYFLTNPLIEASKSLQDIDNYEVRKEMKGNVLIGDGLKSNRLTMDPRRIGPIKNKRSSFLKVALEDIISEQDYQQMRKIYIKLFKIGSGSFGSVYKIKDIRTGSIRVMKKISKKIMKKNIDPISEYKIHKTLDHPNIVRLIEYYESKNAYYLISEFMRGGDLLQRLKIVNKLPEARVKKIIKSILKAMVYCHSRNIIHRDLKLENIMFASTDSDQVKLIDFGLSSTYKKNIADVNTVQGTLYYIPPEALQIHNNICTYKSDTWAIGIIMYTLLVGRFPFENKNYVQFYQFIKRGLLKMDGPEWIGISKRAKRLISGLLEFSMEKRLSAKGALQSDWIRSGNRIKITKACHSAVLDSLNNLHSFKQTKDLERILLTYMISLFRGKSEENAIRECFEIIDIQQHGCINTTDMMQSKMIFVEFDHLLLVDSQEQLIEIQINYKNYYMINNL